MSTPDDFFENRLYERNLFEKDLLALLPAVPDIKRQFSTVQGIFAAASAASDESRPEESVIHAVLDLLGWVPLPKENFVIQGKKFSPDWALFASQAEYERHVALPDEARRRSPAGIVTVVESGNADGRLDTGGADSARNPHFQLLEHLNLLHLPFGILTNGREWRLTDNRQAVADKKYIRVYLDRIAQAGDINAFRVFRGLFGRETYMSADPALETPCECISGADRQRKIACEEDLKKVIYGTDGRRSLFEQIGRAVYAASDYDPSPENLRSVFENALYMLFRLLFVSYFEDRHQDLLAKHLNYPRLSLGKIHEKLRDEPAQQYGAWDDLQRLFVILDRGNENLDIPPLSGALFDADRAPLLKRLRVFSNSELLSVLDKLRVINADENSEKNKEKERRDFRSLPAVNLGGVCDGLLKFEFRVGEKERYHIVYSGQDGTRQDGYFDASDAAQLKSDKKHKVFHETKIPAGALYLVGDRNSRDATARHHTPRSLSFPLVKRAVDYHLGRMSAEDSVLDLRILDNACGSGHILVETLACLADRCLGRMDIDSKLRKILTEEKARIDAVRREIGLDGAESDEFAVLKRILLKHLIYGVDVQPFAVELTKLSLWMETFIFGTPLAFIEHHIKVGNALVGTSRNFLHALEETMVHSGQVVMAVEQYVHGRFDSLKDVRERLNALQDITDADIRTSGEIYRNEILPVLQGLNELIDVVTFSEMRTAEGHKNSNSAGLISNLVMDVFRREHPQHMELIQAYREIYGFFHYSLEFPEVFISDNPGFDIIIGNPPWDKTSFEDPVFFELYRSNYRSMTNQKRADVRAELLADPDIMDRYEAGKIYAQAYNEYLRACYPHAGGAGGRLFRFFVERDLQLSAAGGTINCILPTGLLTEDDSAKLRKHIFAEFSIVAFDGFENSGKIFPDVDSRYKFGLLQIARVKDPDQSARMRFMQRDPAVLLGDEGAFEYSLEDLRNLSPAYMAYLETGAGRKDIDLLKRFYTKFSVLDPAWLDFRNELNAATDRAVFHEKTTEAVLLLYKRTSIQQYDSQYGKRGGALPEYRLDPYEFDKYLLPREIYRIIDDIYPDIEAYYPDIPKQKAVLNELGLHRKGELAPFVVPDRNYFRLGFRDIADDTGERTLIAALLPKNIGAQQTLPLSIPKKYTLDSVNRTVIAVEIPVQRLLFAQCIFNSLVFDWILRFSTVLHVSKSCLFRQPIPQPTDVEINYNPVYAEIVRNSLLLTLHYNKDDFQELTEEFGVSEEEIPASEMPAERLKIRNDVLVAGLYGVRRSDMEHILSNFTVLRKKKEGYCAALSAEMPE
ncbi:MAG: hypothetical protein LBQ51_00910 [Desulfovibrio sp.]|jgi:hypothetical protein|nr:hypothetical protein [Desulfovibrio sp.]